MAKNVEIVIIGTSDLHGNILGYSYEDNKETGSDGMSRVLSYIEKMREEYPSLIVLDNGDCLQGNILTDDISSKSDEPNPVIEAMNIMGYDAMALGNHEFNWGIAKLRKMTEHASFPILAANVKDRSGAYLFKGHTIIKRDGIRVAVIGVVSPNVAMWDGGKEGISDYLYLDGAEAVKEEIKKLEEPVDLIVVSAHMGLDYEYDAVNHSDSAEKIITLNPEVSSMLIGHKHVTVNETISSVPVSAPKNNGTEVAEFHIVLSEDKKIVSSWSRIVSMEDIAPSEELSRSEIIKSAHDSAIRLISSERLGTAKASFEVKNEIRGIPSSLIMDTPTAFMIKDLMRKHSGADIASSPLFRPNAFFHKGDIYYSDVFGVYKFDNTFVRLRITGRELRAYMEWSASFYNQWHEGDINISFNPDIPLYKYDTFIGVDYEIDISKECGDRIVRLERDGRPVKDDDSFTIAVNSYRYTSALKAFSLVEGEKEWESQLSVRDLIVDYLRSSSPIAPYCPDNWKITGINLCRDDKRRWDIINWIKAGLIPVPFDKSYNLSDYERLEKEAKEKTFLYSE